MVKKEKGKNKIHSRFRITLFYKNSDENKKFVYEEKVTNYEKCDFLYVRQL